MEDNLGISAVCRWNIIDEGETADILDLYIREDWRGKRIIQQMLKDGIKLFPTIKRIRFERQVKYPGRNHVIIPVNKILRS